MKKKKRKRRQLEDSRAEFCARISFWTSDFGKEADQSPSSGCMLSQFAW